MAEENMFSYWLAENSMNPLFQIDKLRSLGLDATVVGDTVKFMVLVTSPLGEFLDGKTFSYLTWEEIPDTIPQAKEIVVAEGFGPAPLAEVIERSRSVTGPTVSNESDRRSRKNAGTSFS